MTDHKPQPVRVGRRVTCKVCGRDVMSVRATRLIPQRHWQHQGHQQGRAAWAARDDDGRLR